jgi:hypothetical protein
VAKALLNLPTQKSGWTVWLTVACIALLAAATTIQAAHFCGGSVLDADGGAQLQSSSTAGTLCLTCLMAQSLAAAFVFLVLVPTRRRRTILRLRPLLPGSFLDSSSLFDRPPPAL